MTDDEPVESSDRGGGAEAAGRSEPTAAAPSASTGAAGAESARVPAQPERAFGEIDRARRRRAAKAVVGLTVLVVLVLFVVWNAQPVEVNFVFSKAHPRMIWVMVACAVLGGVLGYLLGRPGHEGRRKEK